MASNFDLFQEFLQWKGGKSDSSSPGSPQDVGGSSEVSTAEVIGGVETDGDAGRDDGGGDSAEGCSAEKYFTQREKGKGKMSTFESKKFRVSHVLLLRCIH